MGLQAEIWACRLGEGRGLRRRRRRRRRRKGELVRSVVNVLCIHYEMQFGKQSQKLK